MHLVRKDKTKDTILLSDLSYIYSIHYFDLLYQLSTKIQLHLSKYFFLLLSSIHFISVKSDLIDKIFIV
jgi:hypothetical protein